MTYLICFGIVVAACCVLTLGSSGFAYAMSRMVEAGFDFVEYRLALRARERRSRLEDARAANMANAVTPFRGGEMAAMAAALPPNKRSTQQLGIARVAA